MKIGRQKAKGHAREKAAVLQSTNRLRLEELATSRRVKALSLVVIRSTVGQIRHPPSTTSTKYAIIASLRSELNGTVLLSAIGVKVRSSDQDEILELVQWSS